MRFLIFLLIFGCSFHSHNSRRPASEYLISNLEEFRSALTSSKDGDILKIANDSTFDLTKIAPIRITKSITLKGLGGKANKARPHFYAKGIPYPIFSIEVENVVIDNIKLEGFETDTKEIEILELNKQGIKGVYKFPVTSGIIVTADNVIIQNSELSGFSHAAIFLKNAKNALIKGNFIHHNRRLGLGYGVSLHLEASAFITHNRFDFNRHSIAASGFSGQSYEASYNWFGANHTSSPLDMHGGKDRGDGTQIGGTKVHIHHNIILEDVQPIFIHRGISEEFVMINDNLLMHSNKNSAIRYTNGLTSKTIPKDKYYFYNNLFKDEASKFNSIFRDFLQKRSLKIVE